MDIVAPKGGTVKTERVNFAHSGPDGVEAVMSANRARVFLAGLKGIKKVDMGTLNRLVLKEGLPKHLDPFGTGRWCFLASEIVAWFDAKLAAGQSRPVPGPGRPRKRIA